MIRTFVFAALMGLGLSAAPALAQDYAPQRVIKAVDLDDLKAIVESLDHTVVEEQSIGEISLTASDGDGTKYLLIGNACNLDGIAGCQGVAMQLRFDGDPSVSDTDLARANLSQAAVSTWRDTATGTIGITRYVVLDHGVTMANVRENVLVLLGLAPSVVNAMLGE